MGAEATAKRRAAGDATDRRCAADSARRQAGNRETTAHTQAGKSGMSDEGALHQRAHTAPTAAALRMRRISRRECYSLSHC